MCFALQGYIISERINSLSVNLPKTTIIFSYIIMNTVDNLEILIDNIGNALTRRYNGFILFI